MNIYTHTHTHIHTHTHTHIHIHIHTCKILPTAIELRPLATSLKKMSRFSSTLYANMCVAEPTRSMSLSHPDNISKHNRTHTPNIHTHTQNTHTNALRI